MFNVRTAQIMKTIQQLQVSIMSYSAQPYTPFSYS